MATEPITTSSCYDPSLTYTAPVGRLPVLGKIRAEIDRLRAEADNSYNLILNRDKAQTDNHDKIVADIAAQATTVSNNTRKIDAEITAMVAQTSNETDKTAAEITALEAQTVNDNTKTVNDTTRTTNDTNRAVAEVSNTTSKTAAEIALLNQKEQTELAQVYDTVATGTVTGVIGKQKNLFQKQTDGFDRDAEQKLAKIMTDTWSVRQTTDGADAGSAGLSEADIKSVVDQAKASVATVAA